jgi:hypothetical protein
VYYVAKGFSGLSGAGCTKWNKETIS